MSLVCQTVEWTGVLAVYDLEAVIEAMLSLSMEIVVQY
jgi:hypothetical protein